MQVSGFFLNITSDQPERLLAFYRDVVGLEPNPEVAPDALHLGGGATLGIDGHSETHGPCKEPARFLLNPAQTWTSMLDDHYVDQAHFVRDFQRFMGMNPSAYAQAQHPMLAATARARDAAVGGAVQALHRP